MGYYIFSYGIKADQIQNAFGSKNQALENKVKENGIFQNYADFNVKGSDTNPDKALTDIIQGNSFDNKSNYAYGYAVIGLCATLGAVLPYGQEIKLGYETDIINNVLYEDFGIEDLDIEMSLFASNRHEFPIPKIDDWPLIGLIKLEKLEGLRNKLSSLNITDEQIEELEDDPDDKGSAYQHLKGILDNINYCFDNKLDLISFCH